MALQLFKEVRQVTDSVIAKIPLRYLTACIRCGIAPAMKTDGRKTFWGSIVEPNEDDDIKKAMCIDLSLETQGVDADKTEANEKASENLGKQSGRRQKCETSYASHERGAWNRRKPYLSR